MTMDTPSVTNGTINRVPLSLLLLQCGQSQYRPLQPVLEGSSMADKGQQLEVPVSGSKQSKGLPGKGPGNERQKQYYIRRVHFREF